MGVSLRSFVPISIFIIFTSLISSCSNSAKTQSNSSVARNFANTLITPQGQSLTRVLAQATVTKGATVPTSLPACSLPGRFCVETYGAKGDGVTDDSAAFNKALGSNPTGTTLYLENKTYIVNSILVPAGISINGQGGATLKLPSSATHGNFILELAYPNNLIENIIFDNNSTPSQAAVLVWGAKNAFIGSCAFINVTNYAVAVNTGDSITIDHSYFTATTSLLPAVWASAISNYSIGANSDGSTQYMSSPTNVNVTSNTFDGTGVNLSVDGGLINGNTFQNSNLGGAIMGFDDRFTPHSYVSRNITITNNHVINVPMDGPTAAYPTLGGDGDSMELYGTGYIIESNLIENTAKQGIVLYGVENTLIKGNTIQNFGLRSLNTAKFGAPGEWGSAGIEITSNVDNTFSIARYRISSGITITANTFADTNLGSPIAAHGVVLMNAGNPLSVSNIEVYDNSYLNLTSSFFTELVTDYRMPPVTNPASVQVSGNKNINDAFSPQTLDCVSVTLPALSLAENATYTVGASTWLVMQSDGNLVMYQNEGNSKITAVWGAEIQHSCSQGCHAEFQPDGNLALYDGGVSYWSTNTSIGATQAVGYGLSLRLYSGFPYVQILNGSTVLYPAAKVIAANAKTYCGR